MNKYRILVLAVVAAVCLMAAPPKAQAEVNVDIGVAPDCPYGYYPAPPYACAPYGYYGPEWFTDGIFIGAGPWYHGSGHFHGYVDRRFDRGHYHGALPERGSHADHPVGHVEGFQRSYQHDEHGKTYHGH